MDDSSGHQQDLPWHERARRGHVAHLTAGYALGALEADEQVRVEHHRRVCPECDQLLAREERFVSLLPFAARAAEPPPLDVKVALFARVAHSRRTAEADWASERVTPPTVVTIPASRLRPVVAVSAPVPQAGTRSRWWTGWATGFLTAPLLVALVVLGTWTFHLHAEAEARGERADSFGATLDRALAGDGTVYPLASGSAAPEAKGWIVTDAEQRSATFYMKGDKARSGQRYRLFGSVAGEPVALGTVKLDDRGRGTVALTLDRPLPEYQEARVKGVASGTSRSEPALWGSIAMPVGTPPVLGTATRLKDAPTVTRRQASGSG